MRVTIVIPVYNVSDYIERCVISVMNQTYADIEVILVDDCTPDDSIVKCKSLVDNYQGPIDFKIVKHERNRGLSAARNTGTEIAAGEYVYYLDSDDEITSDCIALMVAEVQKHPGVEMVQGNVRSIPYKEYYDLPYYNNPCYIESNRWVRYHFLKCGKSLPVNAWNKLTKLSFIKDNHLDFLEGIIHEDELWMYNVAKVLKTVAIIEEKTYIHYATDNSIMSKMTQVRSIKNWSIILNSMVSNLDEPYYSLQLYRIMVRYFDSFELHRKNPKFRSTSFHILNALIHIKDYRVAAMFAFYVGCYPILKGKYMRRLPNRKVGERYWTATNRIKDYRD